MPRKAVQKGQPSKGRRPGNANTRAQILSAARRLFATKGFHAASLRSIAQAANVDVALISHFFGSKDNLFLESIHVPTDLFQPLLDTFGGSTEGFGERFARAYLDVWVASDGGVRLLSTVKSSFLHRPLGQALFEQPAGLLDQFTAQIERSDADDAHVRAEVAFAMLFGVLLGRHVLGTNALAKADPAALAALLAPALQHTLMPDAKDRERAAQAKTKTGRLTAAPLVQTRRSKEG
jgi:AcrR family transcriptional regulator